VGWIWIVSELQFSLEHTGHTGTVLGSEGVDYTDWVALPDDAVSHSSMLVDWG